MVTELRFKDMKLDSIQLHYHYLSTLQEGTASANPQTETLRRVTPLRTDTMADGGNPLPYYRRCGHDRIAFIVKFFIRLFIIRYTLFYLIP